MGHAAIIAGQGFNGVSLASILLLTALGLALSFGLMNVINMAHGEMLMVGGYLSFLATKMVHGPLAFPFALLLSFAGAALLGALLEVTVIRWLYGRPLDTLLATWGVSLILQQAARSLFGAIGVEVVAPHWLEGSVSIEHGLLAGLSMPYVRIFIILLTVAVLGLLMVFIARTRWGLYLRAVHQDREMAQALGVNTRWVDLVVFSMGTGVAGLAGAALALIAPVTPTVGQSYVVYAFLVVIVGGLGSLFGTTLAALLVGLFSAGVQMFTSISLADVWLLVLVILFIQFRPKGIIYQRSRAMKEA
ncbi:urea ABC transporter permease subunit UrtB [Acidipila rosea]|uniref:Urea transport system permease protein n=1 Tax=Acidipila rosea TaxID=768535 RepID=A0A4R1L163_9BACT|nr:urea ABC transporter permease subunit UrtB [Acidipila rosea]MBW4028509.1 urea ABC transporter permease subunit UrtB [Acidobacteriota bacterium]MBW4045898.1 urea ABC transporter permease subunit UrtB [Acidobacteriota bacterium]TCK71656.1 urea transport system permease protein [Acidipila rosea]